MNAGSGITMERQWHQCHPNLSPTSTQLRIQGKNSAENGIVSMSAGHVSSYYECGQECICMEEIGK